MGHLDDFPADRFDQCAALQHFTGERCSMEAGHNGPCSFEAPPDEIDPDVREIVWEQATEAQLDAVMAWIADEKRTDPEGEGKIILGVGRIDNPENPAHGEFLISISKLDNRGQRIDIWIFRESGRMQKGDESVLALMKQKDEDDGA